MALSTLNTGDCANKGRAVTLLHPSTQSSIGIRFHILGSDSNEARRIFKKHSAELLQKQKSSRNGQYQNSHDENEANNMELLTAITVGWDEDILDDKGNVTGIRKEIELNEGEFVPFSPEAVARIYADLGFSWIREQISTDFGDRRIFLPSTKRS